MKINEIINKYPNILKDARETDTEIYIHGKYVMLSKELALKVDTEL